MFYIYFPPLYPAVLPVQVYASDPVVGRILGVIIAAGDQIHIVGNPHQCGIDHHGNHRDDDDRD